ncbi:hypothetical protein [Microbacterium aurum]
MSAFKPIIRELKDDRFDDAIDVNLKRFKRNRRHDSAEVLFR